MRKFFSIIGVFYLHLEIISLGDDRNYESRVTTSQFINVDVIEKADCDDPRTVSENCMATRKLPAGQTGQSRVRDRITERALPEHQ